MKITQYAKKILAGDEECYKHFTAIPFTFIRNLPRYHVCLTKEILEEDGGLLGALFYFLFPFIVILCPIGWFLVNIHGRDLALIKIMELIGSVVIVLFFLYIATVIAMIIEDGIRSNWKEWKEKRIITEKEIRNREFDFERWGI